MAPLVGEGDLSSLLHKISNRFECYYPGSGAAALVHIEGPKNFQKSTIYVLSFRSAPRRIVVKIIKGCVEEAKRHYEALQMLWPRFCEEDTGLDLPRPLDLFVDHKAVVMEEVPGVNLKQLVHANRWSIHHGKAHTYTLEAFERTGRWLRQFHDFGNNGDGSFLDAQRVLREVRGQLKQCMEYGLGQGLADEIYEFLSRHLDRVGRRREPASYGHGDFKLDNMMISDQNVAAVDVVIQQRNLIYYDIASFCNSISLIYLDPHNILIPLNILHRFRERFLQGYFDSNHYSVSDIETFQIIGLISKYAYFSNRYHHHFFHRRYINMFFSRRFRHLMGNVDAYVDRSKE